MSCLIIYRGDRNYHIKPSNENTYVYLIGSGKLTGRVCRNINDSQKLNSIAISLRDDYVEWVYSLNKDFVKKGLTREQLSLFFLTDLSNKRNELFNTYETISNVTLIKQQLELVDIDSIELIGVDDAFIQTISSIFQNSRIIIRKKRKLGISLIRRLLADIKYGIELFQVILINKVFKTRYKFKFGRTKKYFFSFYPQTFNTRNQDIRYGDYVTQNDRYLVTLVADGMHQQVPPLTYFRELRNIPKDKFLVLDTYLELSDLFRGLKWWFKLYRCLLRKQSQNYLFQDLDISIYIEQEVIWSISRVSRLIVMSEALKRLLIGLDIEELIYIVFEYPFGRMISHVCKTTRPDVVRTGFNHGDYSWRFLNYFLAKGEASVLSSSIDHCPIPDRVLAEDNLCEKIYKYNGYQSIRLMNQVYRLKYLDSVQPSFDKRFVLIVAGLHDGRSLLNVLIPEIAERSDKQYLMKPHPRADNRYTKKIKPMRNLKVVNDPIDKLLCKVGEVYVTYSGVGVEAWRLGIPVTLVNIPGKISWSKLLDHRDSSESDSGGINVGGEITIT